MLINKILLLFKTSYIFLFIFGNYCNKKQMPEHIAMLKLSNSRNNEHQDRWRRLLSTKINKLVLHTHTIMFRLEIHNRCIKNCLRTNLPSINKYIEIKLYFLFSSFYSFFYLGGSRKLVVFYNESWFIKVSEPPRLVYSGYLGLVPIQQSAFC